MFIDKQATNLAGEDCYKAGATFESIEEVYLFDKALRDETMNILLEAENAMKTATVYAFCLVHRGPDDYLDPLCYCSKRQYKPVDRYTRGLIRLLSTLQTVRDNKFHKPYVEHYNKAYRMVPLWVASKCLTFGTMSAFFDYQQQPVKTRTCVALAQSLGKRVIRQKDLEYAYHTLPEFRNICAHDERLYCAKVGYHGSKGFDQLLRCLSTVVPQERLSQYAEKIQDLLDDIASRNQLLEPLLLRGMGISRQDLADWIVE